MAIEKSGRIHTYSFPLFALALVPLIFLPRAADPFNVPKSLALFVLAAGAIVHMFLSSRQRLTGIVNYTVVGLAFAMIITSLASDTTLARVLFGLPGRGNGVIYYFSIFALLLVAKNCLITSGFEKRLLVALQVPFLFNIIYATLQFLGEDPIPWANPYNPIIGSLGNPNFASSFLATSAIFYSYLTLKNRGLPKVLYLICASLSLTLSFLTQSIQGPLLFVIALLLLFALWTYQKSHKYGASLIILGAATGICLFLGFLGYGPLSMFREYTFALRFQYWTIAVKTAMASPLFGFGPDSYVEGFRRFRSQELVNTYSVELLADSAHSVPLNIAANFGIIVFILYMALIAFVTLQSISRIRSGGFKFDLYTIFTILWISLFIQSLLSIEQIGLSTTQLIIGGFLLNRHWIDAKLASNEERLEYKKARASNNSLTSRNIQEYKGEISFAALALAFLAILPIIREEIALSNIRVVSADSGVSDEAVQEQFDKFSFYTKEEWNRGVWLYNFLLSTRRVESSNELLTSIIAKDSAATEALDQLSKVYIAENRPNDARVAYLRILESDPLNAKVRISLAQIEKQLGNSLAEREILQEVIRDFPKSKWAETATALLSQ